MAPASNDHVVIIGGGPGGYEAALVAAQLGARVTVVDTDGLGGSAVLTDCVPSKTLIATAELMTEVAGAGELGVRLEDGEGDAATRVRVDLARVNARVKQLAADPLFERLLHAFAEIPEPHRETILRVLERDATWCRIVEQTAATTGIRVAPNPHASLYLHVFGPTAEVPSEPTRRDVDVIRFGIESFVHLMTLFFQQGVHEQWTASARELPPDKLPSRTYPVDSSHRKAEKRLQSSGGLVPYQPPPTTTRPSPLVALAKPSVPPQ